MPRPVVVRCAIPIASLLHRLQRPGVHLDAYACTFAGNAALADYVEAFYTTPLFMLERAILALALRRPSTDAQAQALGRGSASEFAAWRVEARVTDQVLLRDITGRTCSWLMVEAVADQAAPATRLYFGSAVMPAPAGVGAPPRLGPVYRALMGFHDRYSRALLAAARRRLESH